MIYNQIVTWTAFAILAMFYTKVKPEHLGNKCFLHTGGPGHSIGFYIFIAMVCFVVILTIIGFVHMVRHKCHCRVQCCFTCKEEEKEDVNLDYGTYYSQDGERRDNIMEVS